MYGIREKKKSIQSFDPFNPMDKHIFRNILGMIGMIGAHRRFFGG